MNGAVITAKDEAETIGDLVSDLRELGLEVCVIDDGSKDATGEIAAQAGAFVIYHAESLGIAKSLMEGWQYAIWQNWERTVQIDAGGSHDPHQIYRLLTSGTDITIGSRFMPASLYIGRRWRAIASRIMAGMLNFATHKKITDWTSGYRVFTQRALNELVKVHYLTKMHTWQIEVLSAAIYKKLTISEFPITYKAGNSTLKLSTIIDSVTVYLWVFNR